MMPLTRGWYKISKQVNLGVKNAYIINKQTNHPAIFCKILTKSIVFTNAFSIGWSLMYLGITYAKSCSALVILD